MNISKYLNAHIWFRFEIKKLPGNFHLSTHSVDVQPDEYDFGHIIHEVGIVQTKTNGYVEIVVLALNVAIAGEFREQNQENIWENVKEQF